MKVDEDEGRSDAGGGDLSSVDANSWGVPSGTAMVAQRLQGPATTQVLRFGREWSEFFTVKSVVALQGGAEVTSMATLPMAERGDSAPKYMAFGDDRGRVHVVRPSGEVVAVLDTVSSSSPAARGADEVEDGEEGGAAGGVRGGGGGGGVGGGSPAGALGGGGGGAGAGRATAPRGRPGGMGGTEGGVVGLWGGGAGRGGGTLGGAHVYGGGVVGGEEGFELLVQRPLVRALLPGLELLRTKPTVSPPGARGAGRGQPGRGLRGWRGARRSRRRGGGARCAAAGDRAAPRAPPTAPAPEAPPSRARARGGGRGGRGARRGGCREGVAGEGEVQGKELLLEAGHARVAPAPRDGGAAGRARRGALREGAARGACVLQERERGLGRHRRGQPREDPEPWPLDRPVPDGEPERSAPRPAACAARHRHAQGAARRARAWRGGGRER